MDVNVNKEQNSNPLDHSTRTSFGLATDDAARQKLLDIIEHQFDLEIYLKQREIATIKHEITKAEAALQDLKTAVENEHLASTLPEQAHFTRRSAAYFQGGPQGLSRHSRAATPPLATQPRRKVYRTAEKCKLYGRRQDGTYVSLACPACHRDDFANQQGFLNHCRISHGLEFGPHERMLMQCGTPVDESEVPLDSPARLRPVMPFIPVAKKQKKLERPSIKVFEEDVDMEIENERRATAAEASSKASQVEDNERTNPSTPVLTTASTPTPSTPTTPLAVEESNEPSTVSSPVNAVKDEESDATAMNDTAPSTQTNIEAPAIETMPASITATADSHVSEGANTIESGSRFYVKRRIVVGNVSKFIPVERRDPSLKQFTHKWMIYVVEPPQADPVSGFITCARFHLHPSYKPHDVIDVTAAPFKLTRLGWGEFPIRVQLFFVDKRRNKSVDIIHVLRLDDTHSGKQVLGGERSIEIELDRNTDFSDTTTVPSSPAATPASSSSMTAAGRASSVAKDEAPGSAAVKQRTSLLGGILEECVRRYPIVRAGSQGDSLPYTCAISPKQFLTWPVGRRKATEWHRAQIVRSETQKRAIEAGDNVLRMAAEALSTKDVVIWCRTKKYTPRKSMESASTADAEESESILYTSGFCKFCGRVREEHVGSIDDQCPRAPVGWDSKKRAAAITSVTSVDKLLNTLEAGWDESKDTENLDIDVEMNEREESAQPQSDNTEKIEGISDRVERWALDAESMDIANERTLDWIWSVVGQLRLKSITANDMLLGKDGNLYGPTPNFDVTSAMVQRLTVGNLLTQATRVFLKRLIDKTAQLCQDDVKGDANRSKKMMVPYHIYQAAQRNEEFDFLTNEYMGSAETTSQDITKNS